jgi:transcriptional regulator with XRE-family HTH domain
MDKLDAASSGGLSDFLRRSRAAVSHDATPLPRDNGARRVSGLRRSEVAQLAGVSVDYYTRVEQGRAVPTAAVIGALARALNLTVVEREHLHHLAFPARDSAPARPRLRTEVAALVHSLTQHPTAALSRFGDVLTSNALARALLDDLPAADTGRKNVAEWVFLSDAARVLLLDWPGVAQRVVEDLRYRLTRWPHDSSGRALFTRLAADSDAFVAIWTEHRVSRLTHGSVALSHPRFGAVSLRFEALELQGDDQRLVVFSPAADPTSRHGFARLVGGLDATASNGADRAASLVDAAAVGPVGPSERDDGLESHSAV